MIIDRTGTGTSNHLSGIRVIFFLAFFTHTCELWVFIQLMVSLGENIQMWPWKQMKKCVTARKNSKVIGVPKREERKIKCTNSGVLKETSSLWKKNLNVILNHAIKTMHLLQYFKMSYVDKERKCINFIFFKLAFGLSTILVSKNFFY